MRYSPEVLALRNLKLKVTQIQSTPEFLYIILVGKTWSYEYYIGLKTPRSKSIDLDSPVFLGKILDQ